MGGIKYVKTKAPTVKSPTYKAPSGYKGAYDKQLSSALDSVVNWKYDPTKDASYQSLAKLYTQRGEQAARNTMGDAAALNGGFGTSYAVSAAQQSRNDYNAEFATKAMELEDKAYNRASTSLSALRDADDTSYGRYRDKVSDNQWGYEQKNNNYWQGKNFKEDALMNRLNYNVNVYQAKKSSSSGGRKSSRKSSGGGRRSSGSTYYSPSTSTSTGSSSSGGGGKSFADKVISAASKLQKNKKKK